MSLDEIEAHLERLTTDELRHLALRSWMVFVEKEEGASESANQCNEDDPSILTALDEAVAQAEATLHQEYSADDIRARISEWTSR